MQPAEDPKPLGCGGQCSRCNLNQDVPGAPRGARLVLATIGMFVLPLVLALTGAVLAGPDGAGQTLGALGGLAAGVVIAIVAGKLIKGRSGGEDAECPSEPGEENSWRS